MSADTMIIRRGPLYSALAALTPHLPARLTDDAWSTGAGLARLTVTDMTLLALAASKDRSRAVATSTAVSEAAAEEPCDAWLPRVSLDAVVGMLAAASAGDVEVTIDERSVTVREAGVLLGARSVTVPNMAEPVAENRVDAARMLLRAAGADLVVSASMGLWRGDVAAIGRTAETLGEPLSCRVGIAGDDELVLWGYGPSGEFDEYDQPVETAGSRYLAVTDAPTLGSVDLKVLDRQCYRGPFLPRLMDSVMPDLSVEATEADEGAFADAVEAFTHDNDHATGADE